MTFFKSRAKLLLMLPLLAGIAWFFAAAQTKTGLGQAGAVAFVHVNVIPMHREGVLEDQTVLVANGKITAVGPAAKAVIPAEVRKIDARGKYLTPGLTDAHVHLQTPIEFPLYITNGVTTVFNLDGHPAHLLWRKRIESGEMAGPRIFTTGPIFTRAHKPEEAVRMVDEQAALGYDAVKIYNGVSKAEYPALIAEAKLKHLLLMGHVAREPDFEMTLAAGQSIAHLEEFTYTFFNPQHDDNNSHIVYDESKIPEAVRLTAKSGVFVTPTLSTYATIVQQATALDEFLKNPQLRFDPPWIRAALQPDANRYKNGFEPEFYPRIRTSLAFQRKLVKELEKAGVSLLCGTDASDVGPVAGFGIHDELQELVNDGLTPFQALQTATVNPARYFGRGNEFGTIEPGKRADLVLLDGNPLADINKTRAIAGVVVNGRWVARSQLDHEVSAIPVEYARQVQEMQSRLQTNPTEALKTVEENDPYRRLGATALAGIAMSQGIDKLRAVVRLAREKQPAAGLVSEESINALGYSLLGQRKYAEAVTVLRMNTQDFPKSANTWDSLGEALFKSGDTPQAVENYKKALETDPKYENAETARKFIAKYETAKKQGSP
jgi:imidazolonepropionase-like amidohydrolase/Tfp pilus assembly protein PilF